MMDGCVGGWVDAECIFLLRVPDLDVQSCLEEILPLFGNFLSRGSPTPAPGMTASTVPSGFTRNPDGTARVAGMGTRVLPHPDQPQLRQKITHIGFLEISFQCKNFKIPNGRERVGMNPTPVVTFC